MLIESAETDFSSTRIDLSGMNRIKLVMHSSRKIVRFRFNRFRVPVCEEEDPPKKEKGRGRQNFA